MDIKQPIIHDSNWRYLSDYIFLSQSKNEKQKIEIGEREREREKS